MFRTGDVGRLLPSGALELQGRAAFFVKLRGYSVSTGAVEEALKDSSPLVLGAVVAPVLDATTRQPEERALHLSAPFFCNGGKSRLCVLGRHYAGTA